MVQKTPGPPPTEPAKGLKPHLVVKLRPGWRYDPTRRCFISEQGERVSVRGRLPPRTRVVPKVPVLAKARAESLTEPERELARYVLLLFTAAESPAEHQRAVQRLSCVEEVRLPERAVPPR